MRQIFTVVILLAGFLVGCDDESESIANVNYSLPNYEESLQLLRQRDIIGSDENPAQPVVMPQPEDEEPLGLSFYRMGFETGANFSGLSIARTFFGRSEIANASFRTSDLTESNFRWNDFIDVDFSRAILKGADLRASIFVRVSFDGADLSGADLRRSDFQDCTFVGVNFTGALLAEGQRDQIPLDEFQVNQIAWQHGHGPEPSGG